MKGNIVKKHRPGDFELIAGGETTEDVQAIIVSTDNDGNPFELCDMINIYAYCPVASINSANTHLSVDLNADATIYQTNTNVIHTTAQRYIELRWIYTGAAWDFYSGAVDGGVVALYANPSKVAFQHHESTVKKIKIYIYNTAYKLPAGFKYEIYGRRVKNANT